MEILSRIDIANLALEFLDNLDEQPVEKEYYAAAFIVAGLDQDGDIEVAVRTTSDNAFVNIKVLQAAQIVQTIALRDAAAKRGNDGA